MAQPHLIRFRCTKCKRIGYFSTKNRKSVEKKLDLKKYCRWCKGHTSHKEAKIT
ncbi:MAG TPA: 50S ribosomal protein L33 [Candidatus Paceibacterota bacterium]